MDERLDIAVQRLYGMDKQREMLTSPRIIPEIAAQLKELFPLMGH